MRKVERQISDEQWEHIRWYLPEPKKMGAATINPFFWRASSGCCGPERGGETCLLTFPVLPPAGAGWLSGRSWACGKALGEFFKAAGGKFTISLAE